MQSGITDYQEVKLYSGDTNRKVKHGLMIKEQ